MHIASRMAGIAPFHVMELMARARSLEAEGHDIIHMEVGEPDFPTPPPIIAAAQDFIAGGHVHYTPALGLPELREAIAAFYRRRYRVDIEPERIVVTAGASAALLLALGVLTDVGDEWLLTDPGYPCNRHFVRFCGGNVRSIDVGPPSGYQPSREQVASHWSRRTRGLLVASPSNPTGATLSKDRLVGLWEEVAARKGSLLVDEIYHGLTYGFDADTALSIADDIFVVNSFSKYFGMTGWRLGWLVTPKPYVRAVEKLAQNLYISPPTPAQHAALAAFRPETIAILEQRRKEFEARRDMLLSGLRALGFEIPLTPVGAFYIYAGLGTRADDSSRFAKQLIEQAGVAATPGLDFGNNAPAQHMRFAYTVAQDKLAEGLARMRRLIG